MNSVLFLGTGGSLGIPVVGCHCEVCRSTLAENKRSRPSILVKTGGKKLLVDCGQEFRLQAVTYNVDKIDGAIITHAHHDHTAGVDDLRAYYMHDHQPVPCLLSQETLDDLKIRYHYIFSETPYPEKLTSKLHLEIMKGERGEVNFVGVPIKYFSYQQAGMKVNGIRIGTFAYVTDIRNYPESVFEDLKGVEILVVSALRFTSSVIHLTVDEAIAFSQKIGAKMTYLTHISHDLEHERTNAYLPPNVRMAYDGMEISF